MLKNKALIARETIKTTLELTPAESEFGSKCAKHTHDAKEAKINLISKVYLEYYTILH